MDILLLVVKIGACCGASLSDPNFTRFKSGARGWRGQTVSSTEGSHVVPVLVQRGQYQTFLLVLRKSLVVKIYFLTNKQTNMPIEQYTYWSVTINNPDENDYLIVRNPNDKYIRSLVWTPEEGEEGTPHIQAWVRLQRNQSLAFVKKLYPRAHLKPVDKDVYNENTHQYAQKNDETTVGNHHITINDPLPAADSILYKVLDQAWDRLLESDAFLKDRLMHSDSSLYGEVFDVNLTLKKLDTAFIERRMIMERSGLEKIFCSPSYEKMKTKYWREIIFRLKHKQDASSESSQTTEGSGSETSDVSEDYEDGSGSETEGLDEGGSSVSSSSHVSEEYGE